MYQMGMTPEEKETLSFYWFCALILPGNDTAMPTHLSMDCGCFHTTTAELSNCDRKHMVHKVKKYILSTPLQKSVQTPDLINHPGSTGVHFLLVK